MLSRFTRPAVVDILAFDVVVWVLAAGRRVLLLRPPALIFEVCGVVSRVDASRSKLEVSMLSRVTRPQFLATGRRALLLRPPALVFEVCGVPQSAGPFAEHSEAKPERKHDYNYS